MKLIQETLRQLSAKRCVTEKEVTAAFAELENYLTLISDSDREGFQRWKQDPR